MISVADLVESAPLRELPAAADFGAGVALADAAAVEFVAFGPLLVTATVLDGWDLRSVELRSDAGTLRSTCDCPSGAIGLFCRHAVAAAIETFRRAPALRRRGGQARAGDPGSSAAS